MIKAEDETVEEHVSHLHFHIIPRKKQDGVDAWPLFTGAMNDLETMHQLLDMRQRTGENPVHKREECTLLDTIHSVFNKKR